MKDEKIEFIFNSFPEFIEAVKKAFKEYDEAEEGKPRKIACRKAYLMNCAACIVEKMVASYCLRSLDLTSNENIIDLSGAGVAFDKIIFGDVSETKKWNKRAEDFRKNREILYSKYDDASKYFFWIFKDKK